MAWNTYMRAVLGSLAALTLLVVLAGCQSSHILGLTPATVVQPSTSWYYGDPQVFAQTRHWRPSLPPRFPPIPVPSLPRYQPPRFAPMRFR